MSHAHTSYTWHEARHANVTCMICRHTRVWESMCHPGKWLTGPRVPSTHSVQLGRNARIVERSSTQSGCKEEEKELSMELLLSCKKNLLLQNFLRKQIHFNIFIENSTFLRSSHHIHNDHIVRQSHPTRSHPLARQDPTPSDNCIAVSDYLYLTRSYHLFNCFNCFKSQPLSMITLEK